ncbi:DUF1127 domain-containing protein [Dongia sp.]|uniref:DUF1127 domain-containing protein n=1 Tax=Dongia sp. TaxID=1977262 RepID=UPI0035AFEFD7
MPTTYLIAPRRRRAARLLGLFAALATYLARARERRQASNALYNLSDHQLRDIGVSRAEIDHVIRHGRPRD